MKNPVFIESAVDCPLAMLGHLKPSEPPEEQNIQIMHGDQVVNGVALSQHVIEELQRLGISLNWYSADQLKDAVIATHYDGQLIDDPNGVHFRDQLVLSNREQIADSMDYPYSRMRVKTTKHGPHPHKSCSKKKEDEKKKKVNNGPYGLFR